jgi:histidine triad (HIT) family protein
VIPKEHSRNIYDIEPEDLAAMHITGQRVAKRMRDRLRAEGINILQSSEPIAMQTVFHTHAHVIPRYSDDGLRLPAHPQPAEHEELAALAEELRA